jgi:hypothetical protein
VRLASADWRDAPIIEGNHLGTDRDLAAIVRAIEAARELGSKAAFDIIRATEAVPGPKASSRQDAIDLARTASASFGHAVGTAKIGAGPDTVVDSELRVHGLRGLRVADASVMPSINQCASFHDRRPRCRTDQGRQMMKERYRVVHYRRSPLHSSRRLLASNERHAQPGRRNSAHALVEAINSILHA